MAKGIRWVRKRKAVKQFANLMEHRLREYDAERGETGWMGISHSRFFTIRALEEIEELKSAIHRGTTKGCIAEEAADVANFMMMLCDWLNAWEHYERQRQPHLARQH